MTVDAHSATAFLDPLSVLLDPTIKEVELTLDERRSPYAYAALVCSMPAPADRTAIDLRTGNIYLDITLRQDFGKPVTLTALTADIGGSVAALTALLAGNPLSRLTNLYYRPWNGASVRASKRRRARLLVIERSFDEESQELRLRATSLESLLLGDALISTTAWNPGTTSVREIAQLVLDRYGIRLEPGPLDAIVAEAQSTIWQPGMGAWDYLDNMLEPASLRLWCDELGTFRISTRQSIMPGAVVITPTGTMTGLTDSMTRANPDTWYDAVVIEYRWVDDFDLNNVAYDVAGASPSAAVLRLERPNTRYPGPGAAAGILNRGQGRGRVLDVTAVNDYSVSPGIAASITPPETPAQNGYVSAVTFRLPAAEMDVATRGLVDTPTTAYIFGPVGFRYIDVPVGVDYTEFEWSA